MAQATIQDLIDQLEDHDRQIRQQARGKLVQVGEAAIPFLRQAVLSNNPNLRWQASQALSQINTPSVIPVLIDIMHENEYVGVRWAATEGFIRMGRAGLVPLLQSLIKHFDSVWLRESAHHILRSYHDQGIEGETIENVLHALEGSEPDVAVPWAAEETLRQLDES
jgi:HEAT repeat protein